MRNDPVSYNRDIRPLFRNVDREGMLWAFDLWLYEDVAAHCHAILEQLSLGDMPCDAEWEEPKLLLFQEWISSGRSR